jgi:phage-related protein (TIGR01555 family)
VGNKNKKHKTSPSRHRVTEAPSVIGLREKTSAQAFDFFANLAARTGYGSPNLVEGAEYPLVRLTYNYWQLVSLYEGGWIPRRIVDVPAQDMVRAWPTLTSDIDPKDLGRINKVIRRTNTKNQLLTAMIWGRLFGGAGCLICIKGQENELDEPLKLDDIPLGGFLGLCPFDRWSGIYPDSDYEIDFSRPRDFNLPKSYSVQATGGKFFKVHASRILRFTGPTVPTPEREAYSMWGISVIEPVFQELQKRDNVSWNIANLTFRANILGMKFDDLAAQLSGLGMPGQAGVKFEQRMAAINHLISNQSLVPLPKDGGIEATQYSFSGLGEVYQQFCLDVSGAAQIPVARLWGRTITGLGQTGDGDEKIYVERIATDQDAYLRPQLEKLYPVLCASELGEVPDDLDLNFPSLAVPDDKDKAELGKSIVDSVMVALNGGLISPQTAAKELKQSSTKTNLFTNITDEEIAALSDKPQSEGELGKGLFGQGTEGEGAEPEHPGITGLNPASSPSKALKEEDKVAKAKQQAKDSDGPAQGTHFIHGLTVHVETPKGFTRHGKDWRVVMPADYGYIQDAPGADGDALDAYVGPDPEATYVYLIDQKHLPPQKGFDETKVMLGFPSQATALKAYDAGHHRAKDVLMDWTPMSVEDFKRWLVDRDPKKPACLASGV